MRDIIANFLFVRIGFLFFDGLFVPNPLFSQILQKKFAERLVSSEKGRTFALAFRKGRHRNSIFDRLRTYLQDKQRARTYI